MKNTDRFLIGIVVGIIVLVVAAFAITLLRPETAYKADDTPENVAHNYLLAFEQEDFERAYAYLSPDLEGYPADLNTFMHDVQTNRWNFGFEQNHTLAIESGRSFGEFYLVTVRETNFYNNGLFESQPSMSTFTLRLKQVGGEWKLVDGQIYFWGCWNQLTSYCR